jgi:hypothetical protein
MSIPLFNRFCKDLYNELNSKYSVTLDSGENKNVQRIYFLDFPFYYIQFGLVRYQKNKWIIYMQLFFPKKGPFILEATLAQYRKYRKGIIRSASRAILINMLLSHFPI